MPPHQQVTTCLRSGGSISKTCTCKHCTAVVPRDEVDRVARLLIAEWERVERRAVNLSYVATFADMARVVIEDRRLACADPCASGALAIDGVADFQQELSRRAIAWTLADRECDDLAAALTQVGDEDSARSTKVTFQRACRRVEECDESLRQGARQLTGMLEVSAESAVQESSAESAAQESSVESAVQESSAESAAQASSVDDVSVESTQLQGLLAEIEGEISHEHLPRSIELLNSAINVLLDALEARASHIGQLPLDQLAVAEVDAVWAARAACRRLGVPLGWLGAFGLRGVRLSGK